MNLGWLVFIEANDDGGGGDNWSYKSCKAPDKSSPPTNQHPVYLQAGCPSCRPTNSVEALKGKISHSMDLLTPSSPGVFQLCLTTSSFWLPWGRVAMPLISPLMPVPLINGWLQYLNYQQDPCPSAIKATCISLFNHLYRYLVAPEDSSLL